MGSEHALDDAAGGRDDHGACAPATPAAHSTPRRPPGRRCPDEPRAAPWSLPARLELPRADPGYAQAVAGAGGAATSGPGRASASNSAWRASAGRFSPARRGRAGDRLQPPAARGIDDRATRRYRTETASGVGARPGRRTRYSPSRSTRAGPGTASVPRFRPAAKSEHALDVHRRRIPARAALQPRAYDAARRVRRARQRRSRGGGSSRTRPAVRAAAAAARKSSSSRSRAARLASEAPRRGLNSARGTGARDGGCGCGQRRGRRWCGRACRRAHDRPGSAARRSGSRPASAGTVGRARGASHRVRDDPRRAGGREDERLGLIVTCAVARRDAARAHLGRHVGKCG